MKKVLLLAPGYASFTKPLKSSLESLNWNVLFFDYRRGDSFIRVLRFLPIIGGKHQATMAIEKKIIKIVEKEKPDLVITIKGETLSSSLIERLKKEDNFVVNWFPDPLNTWKLMLKIAPFYDYFFHFDPMIVRKLKEKGIKKARYLPFASDIQLKQNLKKKYDLTFVGTYSDFREDFLSKIKNYGLYIWGDPRWLKSKLKQYTLGGRISQEKMKKIIKQSKINLNIHYNAPREGTNLRTFEVLGSGGFLLVEKVKDLDNLFEPNKELVYFYSSIDLKKKINFYLKQNKAREEIANEGYKAAKRNSYILRTKQMLEAIYGK